MSQYRSPQGNPPPIPVQMDKDRLMGQALSENASDSNRNSDSPHTASRAYDELGRPMTVFRRVLRWFRKIIKGY